MTEEDARQTSRNFARTNFVTLAVVKKNLQGFFGFDEREVGKYLTTLVKPNCVVDEDLTQRIRDKRTDGMWSVIDFEPGQVVAHRGQVVDKKTKAAIDQLKVACGGRAIAGTASQTTGGSQASCSNWSPEDKTKGARAQQHVMWLVGALAAVVLILAVATWQLARRRPPVSMVPATVGDTKEWQERALIAEERSEKVHTPARAGLIAPLSQWFSRVLTQRLMSQRRLLMDTHDNAADEMAALEAWLEKVQSASCKCGWPPMNTASLSWKRNSLLVAKKIANCLRRKIEMMRKQLEAERGKNRVAFN